MSWNVLIQLHVHFHHFLGRVIQSLWKKFISCQLWKTRKYRWIILPLSIIIQFIFVYFRKLQIAINTFFSILIFPSHRIKILQIKKKSKSSIGVFCNFLSINSSRWAVSKLSHSVSNRKDHVRIWFWSLSTEQLLLRSVIFFDNLKFANWSLTKAKKKQLSVHFFQTPRFGLWSDNSVNFSQFL